MDRDELFGEGKASSTIAKVTQGDAMKQLTVNSAQLLFVINYFSPLQGSSIGAESEIFRAKMLACERGNKLSEVEDRTEQLATDSKVRNPVRDYDSSCDVLIILTLHLFPPSRLSVFCQSVIFIFYSFFKICKLDVIVVSSF